MKWLILILLMLLCILMVLCYALMVVAHDADEQAERMYEEWRREHGEREGE